MVEGHAGTENNEGARTIEKDCGATMAGVVGQAVRYFRVPPHVLLKTEANRKHEMFLVCRQRGNGQNSMCFFQLWEMIPRELFHCISLLLFSTRLIVNYSSCEERGGVLQKNCKI